MLYDMILDKRLPRPSESTCWKSTGWCSVLASPKNKHRSAPVHARDGQLFDRLASVCPLQSGQTRNYDDAITSRARVSLNEGCSPFPKTGGAFSFRRERRMQRFLESK